jgi:hypothetical protein
MPDNIIHIGYHKTATNWFQRIFYPRVTSHRYIHRKRVRAAFLDPSALQFSRDTALAALGTGESPQGLILCEEELSGNIHAGGLHGCFSKELGVRLRATLPGARVVIFIRNQVDMIASVYKQYIKEGGTFGVNRYLYPERYLPASGFRPAKCPMFAFDHFDYDALVGHYQALFGDDRVHVFAFEEFSRDNAAFMARYRDIFGFEVDLDALPEEQPNPPYGRGTLLVAWLMNHFTFRDLCHKRYLVHIPGVYKAQRILMKRLNRLPGVFGRNYSAADLLGAASLDHIRRCYAASNRRLAARCGLPLEKYGYPL